MISVPFLDLHKVNEEIGGEIRKAINEVVDSGWYILGNKVRHFEQVMADDLMGDTKGYVVGCNSGTDAIILSLLAAGVRPGDEVITVSHTAIPTIAAIVTAGATPVFVDIDEKTWVMDTSLIEEKITKKTKAVITVHLYGNMVDVFKVKEVLQAAGRKDIAVIEDVAQAQGAYLNGCQAGTIGDFGAFSFYPSKNIGALGDGGAICCKDEEKRDLLQMLRNYGQRDRYHALVSGGLNSRLDEIQANILTVKMQYLHEWNRRKAIIMDTYRQELRFEKFKFQIVSPNCHPAWHLCVIAFDTESDRERAMSVLSNFGIQTMIHYPIPAHMQIAFSSFSNQKNNLLRTENLVKRILSIPLNIALHNKEQIHVICALKKLNEI